MNKNNNLEIKSKEEQSSNEFEYDIVPYHSYPISISKPEYLRSIGILFGVNPPLVENARVLELGCSSGSNITRFATSYPNSKTIGIDLSKVEIEEGLLQLKELDIDNLELKFYNILDIDKSWGKFDYIICHGVFSWVPENVRDKIIEICKENLSDNGIAYISYNTYPGWHMYNIMKDMMRFHGKIFTNQHEKLSQAKLFLEFITNILEDSTDPYAIFLKQEVKSLVSKSDSYLYGEYLVENNHPVYFTDFIEKTRKQELEYLGEANLNTMYLGNLPSKAAEPLSGINDIVRTEQYMDFIRNRRFRCTLLCHNDVKINRSLNPGVVENFKFSMNITPEKPENEKLINQEGKSLTFFLQNNKNNSISTNHILTKAMFYAFSNNINNYLSISEITELIASKIKNSEQNLIKNFVNEQLLHFIFKGIVNFTSETINHISTIVERPKVSKLVRMQIKFLNDHLWVTNELNETVTINLFDKILLQYLDGTNNIEKLYTIMLDHLEKKDFSILKDNKETDINEQKKYLKEILDQRLQFLKLNALLIK